MELPKVPEGFKAKGFWSRPEGTTGMVVLVLAGIFCLKAALPFIITLLQQALTAGLLFGAAALIAFLISNKNFRWLVSSIFKTLMRRVTSLWIAVYPLDIMQNTADDFRASADEMYKWINVLKGHIYTLNQEVKNNAEDQQKNYKLAAKCNQEGAGLAFSVAARKAKRRGDINIDLSDLVKKMELLLRVLSKYYEIAQANIADLDDEILVQTKQRKMILAASNAFRSGLKVINQQGSGKEMFDRAMDYLAQDYGQRYAEIDNFTRMSAGFLQSVDIQNKICDEEALEEIKKWEKRGDSMLLGDDEKQLMIAQSNSNDLVPDSLLDEPLSEMEKVRTTRREERGNNAKKFLE